MIQVSIKLPPRRQTFFTKIILHHLCAAGVFCQTKTATGNYHFPFITHFSNSLQGSPQLLLPPDNLL